MDAVSVTATLSAPVASAAPSTGTAARQMSIAQRASPSTAIALHLTISTAHETSIHSATSIGPVRYTGPSLRLGIGRTLWSRMRVPRLRTVPRSRVLGSFPFVM